jgi:hypothetical protein
LAICDSATPAEPGDAGAETEGQGVDAPGGHADAAGHRPVLGHRADEHAQAREVEDRPHQHQHGNREADDDDPVPRQHQVGQQLDAAGHPHRVGDFDVLRTEQHVRTCIRNSDMPQVASSVSSGRP